MKPGFPTLPARPLLLRFVLLKPVLLLLVLLIGVVSPLTADARRSRGTIYNLDYLLLREQEVSNNRADIMVKKATKSAEKDPDKAALKTQMLALHEQRQALSTQIMGLRKQEVELSNAIRAYNRQRKHDGYRIKDLQTRLQVLQQQ